MTRILVLVEGQSEERFVKDVLAPLFAGRGVYLSATLLVTKRVKDGANFKGGITTFRKFEDDLRRLLGSRALVTTLVDYYGLPDDFPGMDTRPAGGTPHECVAHVQAALHSRLGSPRNLIPFIVLHEFETWIFADANALPNIMGMPERAADMHDIITAHASPEHINHGRSTAPSKRLLALFPGYSKTLHGPQCVNAIGLETIQGQCPHMSAWLTELDRHLSQAAPA